MKCRFVESERNMITVINYNGLWKLWIGKGMKRAIYVKAQA